MEGAIEEAALDARLLVEHFTGTTRADAISRPDQPVSAAAAAAVENELGRRLAGEPVHRILGFREFYGLRLSLSAETLEPRPDTEALVEAALPLVEAVVAREGKCRILDLGTGTGAIALALLSAVSAATAIGADVSDDALATAERNAKQLGLADRFTPLKSDWFAKIFGRFDVIVSNPPYIRSGDIGALQAEVRDFDPRRALDGGGDGLDAYRIIGESAKAFLERDGFIALEIGDTQKAEVVQVFRQAGFVLVDAYRDLGGNDRAVVFANA
jgi:release factor glutamine methyltransferase